jgi:hypothetical protein
MVYGWGCVIIRNFSILMTLMDIKLFWLPLSTIKNSGVSFTHICEWKRFSPSSVSFDSFGWIFAVAMVALGSMSMILFSLSFSKLDSKTYCYYFSFILSNSDCFEQHSLVLCQGILWNFHQFSVSFFDFPLPFFSYGLN